MCAIGLVALAIDELTFNVIMNHFKVRSIRSSGVSPDEIAASSSHGSPQSAKLVSKVRSASFCAHDYSQALNSTNDVGDRMNDGAVIDERSPVKVARLCDARN